MADIVYALENLSGKHGGLLEVVEAIVANGKLILILTDRITGSAAGAAHATATERSGLFGESINMTIQAATVGPGLTDGDLEKVERFSTAKHSPVLVIFFDDMKGSAALKQHLTTIEDEEAFQQLRREHDRLLTEIIARDHAGEVVKSTGDGLLAVFAEPSTAVDRALEIQQKLLKHPHLRVRIGMDMGQVRVESAGGVQRDLFGRHVDWAARAESLSDAGHILVTRGVYTDAFGWLPKARVSWKEHGFHTVKEGEDSIEVFEPYNANTTSPMERLRGPSVTSLEPRDTNSPGTASANPFAMNVDDEILRFKVDWKDPPYTTLTLHIDQPLFEHYPGEWFRRGQAEPDCPEFYQGLLSCPGITGVGRQSSYELLIAKADLAEYDAVVLCIVQLLRTVTGIHQVLPVGVAQDERSRQQHK